MLNKKKKITKNKKLIIKVTTAISKEKYLKDITENISSDEINVNISATLKGKIYLFLKIK